MKCCVIIYLITFFICISLGQENEKVTVDSNQENPTKSLEEGVEGFVNIVHGFLDAVQSEDFIGKNDASKKLTFSEVEKIIKDGNYQEFATRWRDVFAVFGGFAACIVIGLLFILCMPLAGCINCCCFCCCKKCGKASSKEDPKSASCKRGTFGALLFLFSVMLLVGAIFAVISNEILHSKLENVNNHGLVGEINSSVTGIVDFATKTADDVVDESTQTVTSTVKNLIGIISDAATNTVNDIKDAINATSLLNQVKSIGQNANSSAESLNDVQTEVNNLKSLQTATIDKLEAVKTNLTTICTGLAVVCPDVTKLSFATNFSGLSDLANIKSAVDTVTGISTEANKAESEFNNITSDIQSQINGTIDDAKVQTTKIEGDILKEIPSIKNTLNNMTKDLGINEELKKMDDGLKQYGDYIWYVFIGVPCLMLLVVVFYFLGLLFGTCGERPGPGAPCCNRGAGSNMICCGVICSYLFGSIIMLVVIVMFLPFGLMYTNGCRYLNDGPENIEKFEFIVNDSLGFNVGKFIDPDHKSTETITIGNILRNCKNNSGLYDAFYLKNLFDIDTILNMTQITSEISKIVAEGNTASLSNINIIPSTLQQQLNSFSGSGITNISFTQYDDVLNSTLVPDLSTLISDLETTKAWIPSSQATKAAELQAEIDNLKQIQSSELAQIDTARDQLRTALNHLRNQTELATEITNLIGALTSSQNTFNTKSADILNKSLIAIQNNLLNEVNTKLAEIKQKVRNLGACRPVYNSVQGLTDSVCVTILDRLNSIWFGLGWGLAFYIPCIVFALLTASLYQRQEPYDESFHRTRKILKKRSKEESQFDNPDIDSYQGQGYDAYGGQGGDNIPLTGVGNGNDRVRSGHGGGGMANQGYYSPERHGGGYPEHRNSGYHDHPSGGGGYPDYGRDNAYDDRRSGGRYPSNPPPYNGHDQYQRASKYRPEY